MLVAVAVVVLLVVLLMLLLLRLSSWDISFWVSISCSSVWYIDPEGFNSLAKLIKKAPMIDQFDHSSLVGDRFLVFGFWFFSKNRKLFKEVLYNFFVSS